jgi:hypothetical protein
MTAERPKVDIAIVDGEPVEIVNAAGLRALVRRSPLGVAEARRRLVAAGVPAHLLAEPDGVA